MANIKVKFAVAGGLGFRQESISENTKTGALRTLMSNNLPGLRNQDFDILLGARPERPSDKQILQHAKSGTLNGFRLLENAGQTLSQVCAQEPVIASDPYIIAVPLTVAAVAATVLPGPARSASSAIVTANADAEDDADPLSPSFSSSSADVGPSAKRRKVETPPKVIKIPKERYLSLGSQAFSLMREDGSIYIDKTGAIANLLCDKKISKGNTSLFFFRPR
jgi:hypothetical protein